MNNAHFACFRIPVFLIAISHLCACDGSSDTTPDSSKDTSISSTANVEKIGPRFTLLNSVVDFGSIDDYETRTTEVRFTNSGDQLLEVKQIQPTCGCTTVDLEKRIFAPGEGDTITLNFTPKGSGDQVKYVKIRTTDPKTPVTNLAIKSNVRTTVEASPRTFRPGDIPLGKEFRASSTLTAHNSAYVPTSVAISGDLKPYTRATLTETTPQGAEKRTWRIDLVALNTLPWGWHTGNAAVRGTIKTPDRIYPHTYSMAISLSAEGIIRADDSMFRFLVVNPGRKISKTIELSRIDGAQFQVIGTSKIGGSTASTLSVTATPSNQEQTAWAITLSGTAPSRIGLMKGIIIVKTDVPGEETIPLRYSANVQPAR